MVEGWLSNKYVPKLGYVMGPENKEWNFFFWPPNVFFSDWKVGRKRSSGEIWAISVVRNIFEKIR